MESVTVEGLRSPGLRVSSAPFLVLLCSSLSGPQRAHSVWNSGYKDQLSSSGWDGQAGVSPSLGQDSAAISGARGREASCSEGKEVLHQSLLTKWVGGAVFPTMQWSLWHPSPVHPTHRDWIHRDSYPLPPNSDMSISIIGNL